MASVLVFLLTSLLSTVRHPNFKKKMSLFIIFDLFASLIRTNKKVMSRAHENTT